MFDFGFSELVVICVVALVVLGPTRLPGLVRKVGRWIGKARAMANDFRQQLENEVNLEELNRMTERTAQQRRQDPESPPVPPGPAAETPADAPLSGTGYPYGMPTDTSSMTESPAAPGESDDTFSHAHAAGAEPQPWSPEQDGTAPAHEAGHDEATAAPETEKQGP